MTRYDGHRLSNEIIRLDVDALRRGDYSDRYFINVAAMLDALRAEGYRYSGERARLADLPSSSLTVGDIVVEAQVFNRRAPSAVVAGVDVALAVLRHAAGYWHGERFAETWRDLEVTALQDGDETIYGGDPAQVQTVLEIRGRYRDFTLLETPILGYLTRATRIATNVYEVLRAAGGKSVLFFPARFDLPAVQPLDGYAYWLAVQKYNHDHATTVAPLVSTDAQARWWGGRGGGTVPHAIIACFLADTVEAMRSFARHIPITVPRIALVDFNNDVVADSLATLDAFWPIYRDALQSSDNDMQRRWTLNGVRLDTASNLCDASLAPDGPTGVNPRLVETVRRALDNAWTRWNVPPSLEAEAQAFCQGVQIVVSGGFNAARVAEFEARGVPVDAYGVGSTFLENAAHSKTDYTMDIVRVKADGVWRDLAKVGRSPGDHPNLTPIDLSIF